MGHSVESIKSEILALKRERKALILAHFYEDGAIQDIADHVGDSLAMAQWGEQSAQSTLLVAGVVFMAESAKILSPSKTVLIPDRRAGCSLVDHSPIDRYTRWRLDHPEAIMVTYVNSSAEVKAISDVCVTSSNAEKVIRSIPESREILFGPDRNLGLYLSKKLDRRMKLWPGSCDVHVLFSARKLIELKTRHPEARVLAHPECDESLLQQADVVGSTSRLLDEVTNNRATREFIIATEDGIFHKMKQARPDALLLQAPAEGTCACNQCPYMKLNTLEKVRDALTDMSPEVQVESTLALRARISLERMLQIGRGESVEWPSHFHEVRAAT